MKSVESHERQEWLKKRGLLLAGGRWPHGELWEFAECRELIVIPMPKDAVDIIFLSNRLSTGPRDDFKGSIFWLSCWSVSSDYEARPGIALYRKFLPEKKHPIDGLGILFDEDEMADQAAAMAIPMIWRWDACMLPQDGEYFIETSNDEFVDIKVRSKALADEWMKYLSEYNPRRRLLE